MTAQEKPTYYLGSIAPRSGEGDSNVNAEPLLPPEVVTLTNTIRISDYTVQGVKQAMARYPDCVRDLVSRGAQRVSLNGIPISVQLGRPRVLDLIDESQKDFGVPGDTAAEAVVAAMKHLGVSKIAVGSRWPDQVNDALIQYLDHAGIEVLTITSRRFRNLSLPCVYLSGWLTAGRVPNRGLRHVAAYRLAYYRVSQGCASWAQEIR